MIITCDPGHIREIFGGTVHVYDRLGNRVERVTRYDTVKHVYYQQALDDDGYLVIDYKTRKVIEVMKAGELRFVRKDGMPCPEPPR